MVNRARPGTRPDAPSVPLRLADAADGGGADTHEPDGDAAPCPDDACPHPDRYHDERIRSAGQAPCSTCAVCAAAVEPPSPVLLCDDCFAELTGQEPECEDDCGLDLDHTGVCAPRAADTDACTECGSIDRLHVVDAAQLLRGGDEAYDHSRAKEDARNAWLGEDLRDAPACGLCGHPVRHGSGAAVTCDVCGSFCCEDHHRRHPTYRRHDLGAARRGPALPSSRAATDCAALDRITELLHDLPVGIRNELWAIVAATGRETPDTGASTGGEP